MRLLPVAFNLALLLAIIGGGYMLATDALPGQPWCRIEFVRLNGEVRHLDILRLQQSLKPELDKGFFALNLDRLEQIVRSFAWVDKVRVARVWPGIIILTIKEHEAVARWGDKALLSEQGWRYEPENLEVASTLPHIIAPVGTEHLMLETLRTINSMLESKSLNINYIELSPRNAWIIRLNNGLEIVFGRQYPPQQLDHFLEIIAKMGDDELRRLRRVDLRYHSGFAVVWNPDRMTGPLGGDSLQMAPAVSGGATNISEKVH